MSKKSLSLRTSLNLSATLTNIFEPYFAVLDENHHEGVSGKDTGAQRPSTQDGSTIFIIGGMIRNLHQQLYDIPQVNGQTFYTITERMNHAESQWNAHQQKYMDNGVPDFDLMTGDPSTYTKEYNYRRAVAQYEAVKELYDELCSFYKSFTGVAWEYKKSATTNTKVEDTKKAALLERMKKLHGDAFTKKVTEATSGNEAAA